MIINLFTKTFLLNDKETTSKKDFVHKDSLFTGFDNPIENMYAMTSPDATMEAILARIKRRREGSFYFIEASRKNVYKYWLPLYFYCLGFTNTDSTELYYLLYNILVHQVAFKKELHDIFGIYFGERTRLLWEYPHGLIKNSINDLVSRFGPEPKIVCEDYLREIPAEYFVNMVGKNIIADQKFNNFRIFDIAAAYLKVRQYIFNSNQENNKAAREVLDIFDNEHYMRFDDMLINNPELEDKLKKLFVEFDFLEYIPLFTHDMKEYISLDTRMGYSAMGLFKYNKALATYIEKIGYTIPTKLGRKKR